MIKSEGSNWVFTIPKELISENYIKKFIERLGFGALASDNKMTADEAWELSETIKSDWWKINKNSVLAKIGK